MVSMRVHGPWAEPGSLNLPGMESRCTSMARIDASGTTSLIIRHEATQRVGDDEDLNYTTNVYGPIQFDDGKGTPITAVHSWTQYKEISDMAGFKLVRNRFEGDHSLLDSTPIGTSAAQF